MESSTESPKQESSQEETQAAEVASEATPQESQQEAQAADASTTGSESAPDKPKGKPKGKGAKNASKSSRPSKGPRPAKSFENKAASRVRMADFAKAELVEIDMSLKSLLQAGVHFGHQSSRWNPKMSQYIYTNRNGIHIINLPSTIACWEKAEKAITDVAASGGNVLFIGTKKQAQEIIREEAKRCGAFYVSRRWLGGMLTNFSTIRNSIERMKKLETVLAEEKTASEKGETSKFTKKERLMMQREHEKLEFSLGGIRDMMSHPDLIFLVDIRREDLAVKEAQRLDVPVVALVDTNCDPANVNFPIPANDDGSRSIRLFAQAVGNAVINGRKRMVERTRAGATIPVAESKKDDAESTEGEGEKPSEAEQAAVAAPAPAAEGTRSGAEA